MTTKTDGPRVVSLDAGDYQLETEILRALSESSDPDDRALGVAGVTAFDAATEAGEPVKSRARHGPAGDAPGPRRDGLAHARPSAAAAGRNGRMA